jgi:Bacterial protein of unknown function (DUF899)
VPSLSCEHGTDRCRCGFYWRAGGVGREDVSQKERSNRICAEFKRSHTYSAYARGTETTMNTYNYLDYVPKGRDEDGLVFTMSWLRHHDRYADGRLADADMPYWPTDALSAL